MESEKLQMQKNVLDFEPELALFVPDESPLHYYEHIAVFALEHLRKGGYLYLEINEAMGQECLNMLQKMGLTEVTLKKDINGKDRIIRSAQGGVFPKWAQGSSETYKVD